MTRMKQRKQYNELIKEQNKKEISIIIGARQVGKTTILKAIHEELSKTNQTLFLDIDIISNAEKVSNYETLINTLTLQGYDKKQKETFYLFLDEFQRYKDLTIIMKNIYDNHNNIKIYASGSSALQIKQNIQESLAGRKKIHHLYPLDFEEFLWFKEDKEAITQLKNIEKIKGENIKTPLLKKYLEEFLIYGGYPKVVLTNNIEEKKEKLNNIFDLYAKKELVEYLSIQNILGVKKVIEYLAINNGQKIRYEEVADRCNITVYEVKQYIEVLKETFIIQELRPFYTNKNKELVKMPKIYFIDNGVRNYFINNFNKTNLRADTGFLFEGHIASELIKQGRKTLKYWQNKQKKEVDIIIDEISKQTAIEIKYKTKIKKEDKKNLKKFKETYPETELKLISLETQKKEENIELKLPYKI